MSEHIIKGECRCGRVKFEVSAAPMITMACHCNGCQKMSGSAFSVSALYPDAAFRITAGEPVIGGLRGSTRHYFCDHCMSWLFTRPQGMDEFVNVRATLLDNPEDFAPFIETCTSEKLSWALTGAAFSYQQFPEQSEFPHLLQTYEAHRKRLAGVP